MSSLPRSIDYVRLVVRNDAEYAQNEIACPLQYYQELSQHEGNDRKCWKAVVRKAPGSDQTLYIFEVWGHTADVTARYMDASWWPRVTRLDYREQLPNLTREDIEAWSLVQQAEGVKGCNFYPLITKDARKNNKRGQGGRGGRIGSFKSERSTTVYARRREVPAIEISMSDDLCRSVVESAQVMALLPGETVYDSVLFYSELELTYHLDKTLGVSRELTAHIKGKANEWRELQELGLATASERSFSNAAQMDFWAVVRGDLVAETGTLEVTAKGWAHPDGPEA